MSETTEAVLVIGYIAIALALVAAAYIENHYKPWRTDVALSWLVCWFWPLAVLIIPMEIYENRIAPYFWRLRRKRKIKKILKNENWSAFIEYSKTDVELTADIFNPKEKK